MSFFNGFKYKLKDSYLLWIFFIFLVFSCLFFDNFSDGDLNNNSINELTHYFIVDENLKQNTVEAMAQIDSLYAKYAILMDADNGRVLYEKDGFSKAPMASTTKIMTLIIALENANMDDIVTVSDYAATMPDVQLNIKSGEQYRLGDLLYSLMLESHNDSAVAIAEHVGGSVEGFANLMNEKARELGAYDTHFVTPNGLDAKEHYTTAYDLALIASYAIKNPKFCEIIATPSYQFHEQSTGRAFSVNNKDRFLTSYPGAIGIKTGFTGNAGYCFVGAANRDDKHLVSVVLASGWPPHKSYKWKDTTKLMDYGFNNYSLTCVLGKGNVLGEVAVTDSIEGGSIKAYSDEDVSLLVNENEGIHYDIKLPESLKAPVSAGETVGTVDIYIDNMLYKTVPLYADSDKTLLTYGYVLKKIFRIYLKV